MPTGSDTQTFRASAEIAAGRWAHRSIRRSMCKRCTSTTPARTGSTFRIPSNNVVQQRQRPARPEHRSLVLGLDQGELEPALGEHRLEYLVLRSAAALGLRLLAVVRHGVLLEPVPAGRTGQHAPTSRTIRTTSTKKSGRARSIPIRHLQWTAGLFYTHTNEDSTEYVASDAACAGNTCPISAPGYPQAI